jgi:hypothetical protein
MYKIKILILVVLVVAYSNAQVMKKVNLKNECFKTLEVLGNTLLKLQAMEPKDSNYGGLICPETKLFHTRAGEAVYPLAVIFKHTGDKRFLEASIKLGNWLITQQESGGEWLETPWTWTGTTADQLLMMSLTYPVIEEYFSKNEKENWAAAIKKAANYLVRNMNPDFATINYCATTPASLAATNIVFPDPEYLRKARYLSRTVLSKMNKEGFIEGEAARVGKVKYGVDPAYELDMSFWGLELYARLTNDVLVHNKVKDALLEHLPLVYPNGIIDGSWGARCYKWTTFGSKTADGSQILFSLFSKDDTRLLTAALRNLEYLRGMIHGGMIGSGPDYFNLFESPPCIYPTFARAKNLALAVELGNQEDGIPGILPSEEIGMIKEFKTVKVALARTENFYTTISAYDYIDQLNWGEGRYSQFPGGGSACNLWVKGFGLLQTSSPTRYIRGEVIHMPEIKDSIRCLTPRIEFTDTGGYYTNLYERNGLMTINKTNDNNISISVSGELRNEKLAPGGVSYELSHLLLEKSVIKTVKVTYHDNQPVISIVEPVVYQEGMVVKQITDKKIEIKYPGKEFVFEIVSGDVLIELGRNIDLFWQPFPAVRAFPVVLKIIPPENPFSEENYKKEIVYSFKLAQ